MYTRQQKYTNNNNRQREKRGGIDSIVMEFYVCMRVCVYVCVCMYVCSKHVLTKVRAVSLRILVLQKMQKWLNFISFFWWNLRWPSSFHRLFF